MKIKAFNGHVISQAEDEQEFRQFFTRVDGLNSDDPKRLDVTEKAEWITALRSGIYPQGKNKLRKDGKYCCLGVKCEIDPRVVRTGSRDYGYGLEKSSSNLPLPYAKLLGISRIGSFYIYFTAFDKQYYSTSTLANLNDEGCTFNQIADVIDYFF